MHSKKNRWCCLRVLYLWLQGILQKIALYLDGSEQDHVWKYLCSPGIRNHMNRQVVAPDPVFPQSY